MEKVVGYTVSENLQLISLLTHYCLLRQASLPHTLLQERPCEQSNENLEDGNKIPDGA